jgi:glyoxylate reductase
MLGREVHGSRLGIIGMGRIGLQVARRAIGFDMQVAYFNRRRREEVETQYGLSYLQLDELLSQSDYVMLCVPLTPETQGMIGEPQLKQMQRTAILINIARGGVVDTDALTRALSEKWIYAAGLDVTEPEPLPLEHPLLKLDNVVVAPHLGSATVQTRQQMSELSVRNLLAGLAGEPLTARVV